MGDSRGDSRGGTRSDSRWTTYAAAVSSRAGGRLRLGKGGALGSATDGNRMQPDKEKRAPIASGTNSGQQLTAGPAVKHQLPRVTARATAVWLSL